jgi:hypothetical protein
MAEPRILARFTGYGGLLDALRARLDEKGITHRVFDDIAGIADGLTNKILQPVPVRYLLPNTLGDFVEATGCQLWLVEVPELNAQLERRLAGNRTDAWPKRRRELQRTSSSPAQAKRIQGELGRIGGTKRAAMLGPKHRSEIARYAAFCRWRRRHSKKLRRKLFEVAEKARVKPPSSPA